MDFILITMKLCMRLMVSSSDVFNILWSDFPFLYFGFYKMVILEGTYAIGEGKKQSAYLNIELHL